MKRLLRILLLFFTAIVMKLSAGVGNVYAQQTAEISGYREEVSRLQKEIEFIDGQLRSLGASHKNSLDAYNLVKEKAGGRRKIVNAIERECSRLERSIDSTTRVIDRHTILLKAYEERYRRLIVNAYKQRDSRLWFMYLLSSSDIEQGYRRWQYLKNYAQEINKHGSAIIEQRALLETRKGALELLKQESEERKNEVKSEYDSLLREQTELDNYVKSLASKQDDFRKELAVKQQQVGKLNREIERLIQIEIERAERERAAAAKKAGKKSESSPNAQQSASLASVQLLNAEFEQNAGKLPWPVETGVITEQFGQHNHPVFKGVKLPFNNGVNISTTKGSNVSAIFDGVVSRVITIPGYNMCVMLRHGEYFTFYCKLEQVYVKSGDTVKRGDVLGYLASEQGNISTLHFEIWKGTTKQDPELWLRR